MSPISQFYAGKSVLVTGATGFIGKVLIEKLLYSCPDLDKIYLLIRGAKGKSPQERMIEMVSERPFNMRLKSDYVISKLVAISSDLAEPQLGLSPTDCKILAANISVIFHVAASVKFEAPLEVNMRQNVVATKELLEVASDFQKLRCFVHVSTAYSNCQLRQIDERIYPMDVPNDPMTIEVTKAMIDNRPNTYTYTKAMAENVASKYASRINVAIVRPSIVMSALKEPVEGWIDTINGPIGLSVLGAMGILQKLKVNSEVVFDLIPVDIVSNALVSIAWAVTERRSEFLPGSSPSLATEVGHRSRSNSQSSSFIKQSAGAVAAASDNSNISNSNISSGDINGNNIISETKSSSSVAEKVGTFETTLCLGGTKRGQVVQTRRFCSKPDGTVRVFNLTTGSENPCSFYHYFSTGREAAYKKPSSRALRPLLTIPKQKGMNPIQYWIHKLFSHLLFAYTVDTLLSLFGQKKMVVKLVNRMHQANDMFDYFCSNQWTFVTDNVKRLRELQSFGDKGTFNCDVRAINWKSYAQIGWLGCRRFVLKEEDDTVNFAKRRYRAICLIYYLVKTILLLAITALAFVCISSPIALSILLIPFYGVVYLL